MYISNSFLILNMFILSNLIHLMYRILAAYMLLLHSHLMFAVYNVLLLSPFAQVEQRVRLHFTAGYTCITMRVTNKES